MNTILEVPITTLADGTSIVIINPASMYLSPNFVANDNYLPFVSVAAGSTTLPFAAAPTHTQSPFSSQFANVSTFGLDSLQL